MENRDNADDVDDVFMESLDDDNERKAPAGGKAVPTADLRAAKIKENDFAEEFPSEMPNTMRLTSASEENDNGDVAELLEHASASTSQVNEDDDRDLAHGSGNVTKKLEHAPPSDPMPATGLGMIDSLERAPIVSDPNYNVAPGAFHVVPSSRNTDASRTLRPPMSSYDSTREFTNEESKQEDSVPNSARASAGEHDGSRVESGLHTVEAKPVLDGNDDDEEEVTIMVAEAQYVRVKWHQRPLFRWIITGILIGALIVLLVVLVARPPSATNSSPTSSPQEIVACNFLSIPDLTECRSTTKFDSFNAGDKINGSAIPSEIGVLKQLVHLDFSDQALKSTLPSEMGLLTQLTVLSFVDNALTSTIPNDFRRLTKLRVLDFYNNLLSGTIPTSLCSLPSLYSFIFIDCNEIACPSGCCWDAITDYACG